MHTQDDAVFRCLRKAAATNTQAHKHETSASGDTPDCDDCSPESGEAQHIFFRRMRTVCGEREAVCRRQEKIGQRQLTTVPMYMLCKDDASRSCESCRERERRGEEENHVIRSDKDKAESRCLHAESMRRVSESL